MSDEMNGRVYDRPESPLLKQRSTDKVELVPDDDFYDALSDEEFVDFLRRKREKKFGHDYGLYWKLFSTTVVWIYVLYFFYVKS